MDLEVPVHVSAGRRQLLIDLAERNDDAHGDGFLGLVLSGSVARGLATDRSGLDVYVVLADAAVRRRSATRSAALDELPVSLSELQDVPAFGTRG